ncbi:C2 domain-containing protein [Flavisericum labens]|uniref:hypothetical protein n=1 Tax=Flavisericum labens TaxID=3377112 RepID=UPI00387AA60A
MKYLFFLFFVISTSAFSQETVEATLIQSTKIEVDTLVSVDNFGTVYFTKNDVFYKKDTSKSISYNNLQLGSLYSANTFNPLKINLFYKDFNTLVILDNRLAEIFKIDFNLLTPYKNVTHVSTGFDNTIWIFNQDQQKLELFDYKTRTTRAQTAPVKNMVLDLKSNYNYCWLLTKNHLYIYNYFGALVSKIENLGYTAIQIFNKNCFLKKGNSLYYLKENTKIPKEIKIPNLLIHGFSVTNETLYIYDNKNLHELQLKIN